MLRPGSSADCKISCFGQVPSGGWFPLVVAAAVLAIAALWHWGCLLRLRAGRAGSVRLIEDVLWPEEGSGSAEQG